MTTYDISSPPYYLYTGHNVFYRKLTALMLRPIDSGLP